MPGNFLSSLKMDETARAFMGDYLTHSGLLVRYPFQEACKIAADDIRKLMSDGTFVLVKAGVEWRIVNAESKMNSDHRVCLHPWTERHAFRTNSYGIDIPDEYIEEQKLLSDILWVVHPGMLRMILMASEDKNVHTHIKSPHAVAALVDLAEKINKKEIEGFYLPIFFDAILRGYAEGSPGYTGPQEIRWATDAHRKVKYSKEDIENVLPVVRKHTGLTPENYKELLKFPKFKEELQSRGKKMWFVLRTAFFLEEILTTGESAALVPFDRLTCGPATIAKMSGDINLLEDTNLWEGDGNDPRNTILRRVRCPDILLPWEDIFCGRPFAKGRVTTMCYGQGPKGGAAELLWKDVERLKDISWLSPIGLVNGEIAKKLGEDYFNPDFLPVIDALGPVEAYKGFYQVCAEYSRVFWETYPKAQQFRQRVEKSYDTAKKSQGDFVSLTLPNGFTYFHTKWVIDSLAKSYRFKVKTLDDDGKTMTVELSIGHMTNAATSTGFVVRIVQLLETLFRNKTVLTAARVIANAEGGELNGGIKQIHDCICIPWKYCHLMHDLARPGMHECLDVGHSVTNNFLLTHGQKSMGDGHIEKVHQAISRNTGWFNIG